MFSLQKEDNVPAYPAVPNSLHSDSFDTNEMRKTQEARADTSPSVTPYLSLRSRLSQIWINRWTVLLVLVLVHVMIVIVQLKDNVGDAKIKALSACTKVEDVGSAMASMPHYLSVGVNEMAASSVEKAVDALVIMMNLLLRGVQAMIVFYIEFLTATYVCLITAFIHGTLDVVADVTKDATKLFNDVMDKAVKEIKDKASDLEKGINGIAKNIEDSIFGGILPNMPKVDFSSPVNELSGFTIDPKDFVKDVRKLNDDLPNFREVQNLTQQAIAFPFDMVRKAINESYSGYRFDRNTFPLAEKQKLTFCSNNNNISGFFDKLFEMIEKAKIIFIVVLVLLALAAIIPMAWMEIRSWRRQQSHARLIAANSYDPLDIIYIASRPITATFGIKLASRLKGKQQVLMRWCIAYATSPPALFILSLAIAGFFSCFCTFILMKSVEKQVPALAGEVGAFADNVVSTLEGVSDKWANNGNQVITDLSSGINNDMLVWITNATDAVNNTLNTFVDTMNEGLETVFNGTILIDPIKAVLHCVIGIKVENVQKGLTWVHDHAHVSFPLFNNSTFSKGAKDSVGGDSELNTFLASPSSVSTDEVTGAVQRVVDWLMKKLVQDALIATGILLVYIIVVLIGLVWTLAGMAKPDRDRAEGGGMPFTRDNRTPLSPHGGQAPPYDNGSEQFPRFGSSSAEDITYAPGANGGGEKVVGGAYGARARQVPGNERNSSYGHFDSDTKY